MQRKSSTYWPNLREYATREYGGASVPVAYQELSMALGSYDRAISSQAPWWNQQSRAGRIHRRCRCPVPTAAARSSLLPRRFWLKTKWETFCKFASRLSGINHGVQRAEPEIGICAVCGLTHWAIELAYQTSAMESRVPGSVAAELDLRLLRAVRSPVAMEGIRKEPKSWTCQPNPRG
jgi:hypothetical protein